MYVYCKFHKLFEKVLVEKKSVLSFGQLKYIAKTQLLPKALT